MRHSNAARERGIAILVLLLAPQAVHSLEITGTDGARTACDDLTISVQLDESFKTKVSTGRSKAKTLQHRAFVWQIASEAEPDTAKRRAKQALQLMLQQRSRTQLEAVEAVEGELQQAAKILNARAASIYTARKLQLTGSLTKESVTKANLENQGAAAATCTITQQLKGGSASCDETKINSKPTSIGTTPGEAEKQVKLVQNAYLQRVTPRTKAVAIGTASAHARLTNTDTGDCAASGDG
uniref:Variant surface glycoprotein n=1 Tax=Trypanosoma brucei TaxID=5691 RepID=A0A1V0FZR9_9TRYP|nr:variant surface glycoprotein [Trypanosoma brucei]